VRTGHLGEDYYPSTAPAWWCAWDNDDVKHGRSAYNKGCRCPVCSNANTQASRDRRARLAAEAEPDYLPEPFELPAAEAVAAVELYPGANVEPARHYRPLVPLAARIAQAQAQSRPMASPARTRPPRRPLFGRGARGAAPRADGPAEHAEALRAVKVAAWDDYARRLSWYLAGKGESPDLQDARRLLGRRPY
jgi:hypothetical protein